MKTKKSLPCGIISAIYLLIFLFAVIYFIDRVIILEEWANGGRIWPGVVLLAIAAYTLYWLVKTAFVYRIYINDEKIWMNDDYAMMKKWRIQYATEVYYKDIADVHIITAFSNSLNEPVTSKDDERKYLEITLKDGKQTRLYISRHGLGQIKKIKSMIEEKAQIVREEKE